MLSLVLRAPDLNEKQLKKKTKQKNKKTPDRHLSMHPR